MPEKVLGPRPEYLLHCSKTGKEPEPLETPAAPDPKVVRGPRGEPIVPSSSIPSAFADESMCGN